MRQSPTDNEQRQSRLASEGRFAFKASNPKEIPMKQDDVVEAGAKAIALSRAERMLGEVAIDLSQVRDVIINDEDMDDAKACIEAALSAQHSDLADELEALITARQSAQDAIDFSKANMMLADAIGEHWPTILTALRSNRAAIIEECRQAARKAITCNDCSPRHFEQIAADDVDRALDALNGGDHG